jgi:hypothetical protein
MRLLVDKDWGSSSLWVPGRLGGWASCDHHSFHLPQELLDRCEYLSDWYESYSPGSDAPEPDWHSYSAYKLALAIDLKRHFGPTAHVFVWQGKDVVEITGSHSLMTKSAP